MSPIPRKALYYAAIGHLFLSMPAAAAPTCTLSASDLNALALSPSKLTAQEFSAAALPDQKIICETRLRIKQLDAHNGVIECSTMDIISVSDDYLSPAENARHVDALRKFLPKVARSPCAK
jgi:hypothetical protein